MRLNRTGCLLLSAATAATTGAAPAIASVDSGGEPARNVIVMIADGWGFRQIATTDYFQYGWAGSQVYEHFPIRTAMSTFSVNGGYDPTAAWSSFGYVASGATDSAAAATAMSTGVKTYNAAIGVDRTQARLTNAFQRAERAGRATGVVTSVPMSHATPAGFVAHNISRGDYIGIAQEMIYQSAADVIMGTGNPCFDNNGASNGCTGISSYVGGPNTWADLNDADGALGADADGDGTPDRWTLVQTREEFKKLASGDTPGRVIGIPQTLDTLQQQRQCAVTATNPITSVAACADAPYTVPLVKNVPTLAEMSAAALNVLDSNQRGFALMIEGGAVDYANHGNSEGRLIEELSAFNDAVNTVVAWIERHGGWNRNVLVVTGDHETGYLTGPGSDPGWTEVVPRGVGRMPLAEYHSETHTNSLIPLFARGRDAHALAAAADQFDPVRGAYLDNTELGAFLGATLS